MYSSSGDGIRRAKESMMTTGNSDKKSPVTTGRPGESSPNIDTSHHPNIYQKDGIVSKNHLFDT